MMLDGKVALITGAGSGIGRATALRLAREGAAVACADLDLEAARATAEQVVLMGRDALEIQVDVRSLDSIQSMVTETVEHLGRLDILVPCAGVVQMKKMLEVTEEDWDRLYDINVKGAFFTLQAAAKPMMDRRGGAIVLISSVSAQGARPMQVHYASGKAAIINIAWTAAATLAPHGIRVNTVVPGIVETPMWDTIEKQLEETYGVTGGQYRKERAAQIPLGRLETAEDVAGAIAFLVGPDASYITGQTLNVDGGFEMR
jgi:NAD(P)-dependent dehydrogenase (short-subunit alcohol dehydrogenase family)